MKWYRIVQESDGDGGSCYRIQQRGWLRWNDVRYVAHGGGGGLPLTKILRFDSDVEARLWIENRGARGETAKVVIGTYGVYG